MGNFKNWLMVILGVGVLFAGLQLYGGDPLALFLGFFGHLGDWIASIPFMRKILGVPG